LDANRKSATLKIFFHFDGPLNVQRVSFDSIVEGPTFRDLQNSLISSLKSKILLRNQALSSDCYHDH
jgi:hypothetical protein